MSCVLLHRLSKVYPDGSGVAGGSALRGLGVRERNFYMEVVQRLLHRLPKVISACNATDKEVGLNKSTNP